MTEMSHNMQHKRKKITLADIKLAVAYITKSVTATELAKRKSIDRRNVNAYVGRIITSSVREGKVKLVHVTV